MKTLLRGVCVTAVLVGGILQAHAADLVVAMPNWPSGQAAANIIKAALEKSLGLEVDVAEMGTLIAFSGMDAGTVDVYPEVWRPNFDPLIQKYATDRGTIHLSSHDVSATQGLCVTQKTYDEHGVRDVVDLKDPAKARLFDTDGDGKGEMWIGARGWLSTDVERIRAKSYGYAETMTLLEMPEEVGMSAVDAAVATDKPIVFYCYSPHHVFQLHQIKQLSEPAFDPAKWKVVLQADDPLWLSKSDAPVAWMPSSFSLAYASSLSKRLPAVARFLDKVDFNADEVTAMGYALEVERQDPAKFAEQWVATHEERVKGWLQ
ncbi:glycine betaine ABC transporter substrate-binding protein [Aminobacter sp. P9b]|uniref:ABC transporter substrate-binding protein n=1 Tax=Aminobacter sp. P9b TaxID=3133697 RepID=UPI0032559FA6